MKRSSTRLAAAATCVALIIGLAAGSAFTRAQSDVKVDAPLTAYVDFLSLLGDHHPLAVRRVEISRQLEMRLREIDEEFGGMVAEQARLMQTSEIESPAFRQARTRKLDLERRHMQEELLARQWATADLREAGIRAFENLRNLANDVARSRGYTQLLNIVGDPESVMGTQDDFQQLQQQLLISPVLLFDKAHDITEIIRERARIQWDPGISFHDDGIKASLADGSVIQKNGEGELEIRLGQVVKFSIQVLKHEQPAEGDDTRLRWGRTGLNTGNIDEDSGEYTAPSEFPVYGDAFVVRVSSVTDPTVRTQVRIRLVDKDGAPRPEPAE
jgi:hypothetical protein